MRASDSESSELVASSRMRMRGSARMARAMETRWRWPPESLTPRSPTMVSYCSGKLLGELVDAGDAAGFQDLLFGGVGAGEGDVLADGAVEEEGLLQHDAELRAVAAEADGGEVDAVDQNLARRWRCGRRRSGR